MKESGSSRKLPLHLNLADRFRPILLKKSLGPKRLTLTGKNAFLHADS